MAKNFNAWPKHYPKTQTYPEIPVYQNLRSTAMRAPNRVAIIFGSMELTYGELKELADRFASALVDMGVEKADRVAIHLPNSPQFAIAYYGTLKIGAVFTPMSPLLSPREITHQLTDSGAETLVTLDLLYPGVGPILPETKVKRVISTSIADNYNPVIAALKPLAKIDVPGTIDMAVLLKQHQPHTEDVPIDVKKDLAHLGYTGGTTGLSKGVMLTHFNVVANSLQFAHWSEGSQTQMVEGKMMSIYPPEKDPADRRTFEDEETMLVVVPWFHAMGSVAYLNLPVARGYTMVVFPRFEAKEYLDAIGKYRATILGGAPQLYIPLISLPDFDSCKLSSVKIAGSGAAPLPVAVMNRLLESFSEADVREGYGLTECTMGATSQPPGRENIRQGSIGIPVFDTELKVVDLDTGETLPPGKEGEICIRGPQVMQGYYNKPEETAEVLKDGWLHTGDIGKEDEDGYFYITDRKKDMIIYKGYNVYPRELEEVIFGHPAVEQCAVVGKPHEKGELPVAFVQLKAGQQASASDIIEHTNSQVAEYKKLREVIFVDAIPVSGAGKVLKRELRNQL